MSTALRTSLVAAYLTEHPWMMRRAMLESICAVVARHERGEKMSAEAVGRIVAERADRLRLHVRVDDLDRKRSRARRRSAGLARVLELGSVQRPLAALPGDQHVLAGAVVTRHG